MPRVPHRNQPIRGCRCEGCEHIRERKNRAARRAYHGIQPEPGRGDGWVALALAVFTPATVQRARDRAAERYRAEMGYTSRARAQVECLAEWEIRQLMQPDVPARVWTRRGRNYTRRVA